MGADRAFTEAMASDDAGQFLELWEPLAKRIAAATDSAWLSTATLQLCVALAQRVDAVASNMCAWQEAKSGIIDAAIGKTHVLLAHATPLPLPSRSTAARPPKPSLQPSRLPSTADNLFLPYRTFFLAHLSHPYPPTSLRPHLLTLVPTHTPTQLANWFVNARRRSGWGDLKRLHGGGTTKGLEELLEKLASPTRSWEVSLEAQEAVERVRAWFEEGGRDKLGEDVREIVEGRTPSASTAVRNVSDSSFASTSNGGSVISYASVEAREEEDDIPISPLDDPYASTSFPPSFPSSSYGSPTPILIP